MISTFSFHYVTKGAIIGLLSVLMFNLLTPGSEWLWLYAGALCLFFGCIQEVLDVNHVDHNGFETDSASFTDLFWYSIGSAAVICVMISL